MLQIPDNYNISITFTKIDHVTGDGDLEITTSDGDIVNAGTLMLLAMLKDVSFRELILHVAGTFESDEFKKLRLYDRKS